MDERTHYELHALFPDGTHRIRLTANQTRKRTLSDLRLIKAEFYVKEVTLLTAHPRARLRAWVVIEDEWRYSHGRTD